MAWSEGHRCITGHIDPDWCWLETDFCWNPSGWRVLRHPDTKCPASILDMAWQAGQCAGGWGIQDSPGQTREWRCHPAGLSSASRYRHISGHFCPGTDMQVAPLVTDWPKSVQLPPVSQPELLSWPHVWTGQLSPDSLNKRGRTRGEQMQADSVRGTTEDVACLLSNPVTRAI